MNLISKHLDRKNLKTKVYQFREPAICAYSGQPIMEGVLMSDLIGERFTERQILRYNSKYLSVEFALLISDVIPSEKGFNILRNYSFFASENHFRLLKREDILLLLLNIPETPFQLGITYSSKKHIAYKTPVNYDTYEIAICTDLGQVVLNMKLVNDLLPIMQNWYTVVESKKENTQQPTYFTKSEILGESYPSAAKIKEYGTEKFMAENQILSIHRKTMYFNLITHILNKKT